MDATLTGSGIRIRDIGPATVTGRARVTTRRVTIDGLDVRVGANEARANGSLDLRSQVIAGTVSATLPQVAEVSNALPQAWRPEGALDMSASLGGTLHNPIVDGSVTSNGLRIAGQRVRSLRSTFRLADAVVAVYGLELAQEEGRLDATARYGLTNRSFVLRATGRQLKVAPLPGAATEAAAADAQVTGGTGMPPITATIDIDVDGSGLTDHPRGTAALRLTDLSWGGYALGAARATAALADGHAQVDVTLPAAGTTASADLQLDTRAFRLSAAVVDADLATLIRASGPVGAPSTPEATGMFTGLLTAHATAEGSLDHPRDLAGAVNLDLVGGSIGHVPIRLDRPLRVRREKGQLVADDVALRLGGSTLVAAGALGSTGEALTLKLDGTLADFLPVASLAIGRPLDGSGAIHLDARAAGTFASPDVTAHISLSGASVASGDLPPLHDLGFAAQYVGGVLTVDRLSGRWQEAELTGSAQLPAALLRDVLPRPYLDSLPKTSGPAHASLQVTSLTPAVLAPFLSADTLERLGGRVDLTASMEADEPTLEAVRGDITLDRAEFTLARVPVQQTQPTRLRLAAGRVTVEQWAWAGGGNQLALKGGVTLNGPVPTLDLGLNGSIDLRMLGAFVPEAAIGGRATVDVTVGGTTTEPLLDGRVVVEDTDIVVRDPRLAITSLAGTARLTRDRVVFEDVTASANGGQLRLAGGLDYHDFALTGGTLTVTGHGLALEAADGLRTEVDANLSLAAARDGPSLEGQVTILRGAYRKPVSLAEQLLSTATTAIPAAAPGNVEPSFLDRLSLGVAVVSAEDVQIDNNYGRFDVASNLRVSGTASDPVLRDV